MIDTDESVYRVDVVGSISAEGKKKRSASIHFRAGSSSFKEIPCLIDTGATCNVMSFTDACDVMQDGAPQIERSNVKLKPFRGKLLHQEARMILFYAVMAPYTNFPSK